MSLQPRSSLPTIKSGSVEVDFARRRLLVRGKVVDIAERTFDILELLVRADGELVSKDELLERVWPGRFIGDNTLEVHISSLRKALGENRGLLKTAYGRGYRILGSWNQERAAEPHRPGASPRQPTTGASRTNLPAQATLIGRDDAASAVAALVEEKRFVTLVGTGGIGKTRLALEVARRLLPSFEDGVWLIELGPLSDPSLVPGTVAAALGIDIAGSPSPSDLIARALGTKQLLLILDTCEHLVEAAAMLSESVLRAGSGVRVLATSRETLRAEGEHLYPVPPLSVPSEGAPPEQVADHSSVQLFLARATGAKPGFAFDDRSMVACGVFCRRLDGIPLAIELAAARAATLGMEVLAAQLDDHLQFAGRGLRTALPRHQTLRATLDWSFQLLTEAERAVLRRLSTFAGAFDIDAATCVTPGDDIDATEAVDHVAELVAKSLLVSEADGIARRYRLLDTTRAYGLEKLGTGKEWQAASCRHATYFRDVLERAVAEWGLLPSSQWLAAYGPCIDDVRAALDWAFSPSGDIAVGAELAVLSAPLWFQLSLAKAGSERFERALASLDTAPITDDDAGRRVRMHLNAAIGWLGASQSAVLRREQAWTTTRELARSLGDLSYEILSLWSLCYSHYTNGEYRKMWPLVQELRKVAARSDEPHDLACAERTIAHLNSIAGRHAAARDALERLLEQPECRVGTPRVARYQFDHRAAVRIAYSRILWVQGFAEKALVDVEENVRETADVVYLNSFWSVLCDAAMTITFLAGDFAAMDRYAALLRPHMGDDRMIIAQGFVEWLEGVVAIKRGNAETGLPSLRAGLAQRRTPGRRWNLVFMLGQTAEALAWAGLPDEALSIVEEGLDVQERTGASWHLPELLRIKGEVLLMQGQDVPSAKRCFEQAFALGHEHGALAWQLRAASSLARLHRQQGRLALARDVLAPVYGRFTEGFATADLREAESLLKTLDH